MDIDTRTHWLSDGPQWTLYDRLIDGVPDELTVEDYCLGHHWSCVVASCGAGVSYTCRGGASYRPRDMRGQPLKAMARLAKSWSFEEATLGVAALNAYYARPAMPLMARAVYEEKGAMPVERTGRREAFAVFRPIIEARGPETRVVVVGHFPNVTSMASYCNLVVLERTCRDSLDTPDPACEYVVPGADFLFITGVTLINKTATRLLELGKRAFTVMVGPSVVPAQPLFDAGVDNLSGRVVVDPEAAMYASRTGNRFGSSLRMYTLAAPEA